jgi:hypothetical protein
MKTDLKTALGAATLAVLSAAALLLPANAFADRGAMRGSARTSINNNRSANINSNRDFNANRNTNINANRNVNVNANRNVNVNTNRNVGVYVDNDYHHNHYHPIATAAAVTATVAVTSAVIGSVVRTIPPSCVPVQYGNMVYQQCGNTWYQPQYYGSSVQYIVVTSPY